MSDNVKKRTVTVYLVIFQCQMMLGISLGIITQYNMLVSSLVEIVCMLSEAFCCSLLCSVNNLPSIPLRLCFLHLAPKRGTSVFWINLFSSWYQITMFHSLMQDSNLIVNNLDPFCLPFPSESFVAFQCDRRVHFCALF